MNLLIICSFHSYILPRNNCVFHEHQHTLMKISIMLLCLNQQLIIDSFSSFQLTTLFVIAQKMIAKSTSHTISNEMLHTFRLCSLSPYNSTVSFIVPLIYPCPKLSYPISDFLCSIIYFVCNVNI